jgi:hypothetical protein
MAASLVVAIVTSVHEIMHGKVIMSQTDYHLEEDGPVIERA